MAKLNMEETSNYVNDNIISFHQSRLECLKGLKLKNVLRKKNPYLFKAKNLNLSFELVSSLLDAYLSSSEEELFGNFLEDISLFVASRTCGAKKSSADGVDFEFVRKNIHYLVSVKSGPNWGNNAQQNKQEQDFNKAVKVLKQSRHVVNAQPILGICYGKTRSSFLRGYWKYCGQNFWYFISKEEDLYTQIIEPLGYRAREHNENFKKEKERIVNLFTVDFSKEFCSDGNIDWKKLVQFNCGNLDIKV